MFQTTELPCTVPSVILFIQLLSRNIGYHIFFHDTYFIFRDAINDHARNNKVHNAIVERLKTTERIYNEDLTLYTNQKLVRENVVTARVFRSVYCATKMGSSTNSLPEMMHLMRAHNVIVGQNCKDR